MDHVQAVNGEVVSTQGARRETRSIGPALIAATLGAVIVFGVGFAGSQTIHDAAHDSRHSLNFPCH